LDTVFGCFLRRNARGALCAGRTVVAFLIAVPMVACGFFVYVLIEFWRDEHGLRKKPPDTARNQGS
jgi:hypothetical protein